MLIVTDPDLARLPHLARLQGSLQASGIETNLFAGVSADPPIAMVQAALAEAGAPEALVSLAACTGFARSPMTRPTRVSKGAGSPGADARG